VLLSEAGYECLEDMAQRAHQKRTQHFGKAVVLYTPLYLANHCINGCTYCGYNVHNKIDRHILSTEEIETEAKEIAKTGLKHILILTGESAHHTPVSYIVDAVKILRKYFESISIEIYPLTSEEYKQVIDAGVDGLTIYQEVYNPEVYDAVHVSGPKKNYPFRLQAPEPFKTAWHAHYLQKKYPELELGVSMPRIRPCAGGYQVERPVDDKAFVQIMLALGCLLPSVGITISTREQAEFRNNLIPLGATKLSAGVSTAVGGHSKDDNASEAQFEISDTRTVEEMKAYLLSVGYQ
ncbi:putative multi-domain containing protein, partial [Aduncisulcus paluster]